MEELNKTDNVRCLHSSPGSNPGNGARTRGSGFTGRTRRCLHMAVRDGFSTQQPDCADGTALISMACEVRFNEDLMWSVAVHCAVNSLCRHFTGTHTLLSRLLIWVLKISVIKNLRGLNVRVKAIPLIAW